MKTERVVPAKAAIASLFGLAVASGIEAAVTGPDVTDPDMATACATHRFRA